MKKKLLIPLLILATVLVSLFVISYRPQPPSTDPTPLNQQQTKSLKLEVEFDENDVQTFTYETKNKVTAFELLEILSQENENLELDTQQYDFGVFVKSINGFESSAEKAWIYFVNGESGQIAADQYDLNNGDLVEWKYITPAGE